MNRTTLTSAGPYISAGIVTDTKNCCGDGEKWHVKLNKSFRDTLPLPPHLSATYCPVYSLVIWAVSSREEVFIFVQESDLFFCSFFSFLVLFWGKHCFRLLELCTDCQTWGDPVQTAVSIQLTHQIPHMWDTTTPVCMHPVNLVTHWTCCVSTDWLYSTYTVNLMNPRCCEFIMWFCPGNFADKYRNNSFQILKFWQIKKKDICIFLMKINNT